MSLDYYPEDAGSTPAICIGILLMKCDCELPVKELSQVMSAGECRSECELNEMGELSWRV